MDSPVLPTQMQAVEIDRPGPDGALRLVQRPVPRPGAGELLIRVMAAGVNRPDCLQRRGMYPPPPGVSDLPGLEVAGTVAAVGPGTQGWQAGDAVCALLAGGGYAEYCVAPVGQCLPIPRGLNWIQAAALPEAMFTVWANLFERGALAAGDTVLIHGGASGIGTTAIQLARAFAARVYATAGTDAKTELCERLGAERAINYRRADFADVIRNLTGNRGVDIILDIVGAKYFGANETLLADDGRLLIIGLLGGARTEIDLGRLLTRRLTITGSTLRNRSPEEKAQIAQALREWVWPRLARGQCLPVIQKTFPLADASAAHAILEANESMGKLVLVVND